jgi:hypothetical protein
MDYLTNLNDADPTASGGLNTPKKVYHSPKVLHYGSLAELVQLRPNRGRDGETRWIDCTSG